mgnify:CR=1 FL=1
MSLKAKRKRNMGIMIICLILIAIVFIYPVYLMFMNSFKPFGEIVADVLAFPKHFDLSNYTYVIKKMDYALLFRNNVIITVIGIAGIVVFLPWQHICSTGKTEDIQRLHMQSLQHQC